MEYGMMYYKAESFVSMATENPVFFIQTECLTKLVFFIFSLNCGRRMEWGLAFSVSINKYVIFLCWLLFAFNFS